MLGKLNEQEINNLLIEQNVGRIACYADGKIYLVPVTYIYEGNFIIGHTNEGTKVRMMRKNPEVCFETDKMDDIFNWQSVIVWGLYEELKGDEAAKAFQMLYQRLEPLMGGQGAHPHVEDKTIHKRDIPIDSAIVYRIRILEKTGRFEKR
jgi:nitroimidazol reductase NimA-like FMN-containing flavoprotein (pyridoxamine 5'-phosphate oxidase superfamily)